MSKKPGGGFIGDGLAQIGALGLFLLSVLAAVPRSLRYFAETVRQIFFVGAMSLVIIVICGLFIGLVLGLQLYEVLSRFGSTASVGTVVAIALYRELGPVVTALAAIPSIILLWWLQRRGHFAQLSEEKR